jgi:hypothetical protein
MCEIVAVLGSVEPMFESCSDAALIDGIGAASRAESAGLAQRFALIGELDARRTVELVERRLWRTDPYEEVATEISAAQNISRGRAGGQINFARALRDGLPAVAAVVATGGVRRRRAVGQQTRCVGRHSVCQRLAYQDQRRADAIRALTRRESALACRCGSPDCPAAAQRSALSEIVITLIDPTDGSNKFGSWLHSTGVAQQIVGSAAAVATAAP